MLGNGAVSPLSEFMGEKNFRSVLEDMRLSKGLPWTIPIVLGTDRVTIKSLTEGKAVALREETGQLIGILDLTEIYSRDARKHVHAVFGTYEECYPVVKRILRLGDALLSGQVTTLPVYSPNFKRDAAKGKSI